MTNKSIINNNDNDNDMAIVMNFIKACEKGDVDLVKEYL